MVTSLNFKPHFAVEVTGEDHPAIQFRGNKCSKLRHEVTKNIMCFHARGERVSFAKAISKIERCTLSNVQVSS